MSEPNYLRIASILGGTLQPTHRSRFGRLNAGTAAVDRLRMLPPPTAEADKNPVITPAEYPLVAKAFDETSDGYEVDRLLIDPVLSRVFFQRCRQYGIIAPERDIAKRLQSFRKAKSLKIELRKGTKPAGIRADPFLYAAEMGYSQLSFVEEASVDDIVTDPEIGHEFVKLCKIIKPHGTAMQFKWAALSLRKHRSLSRKAKKAYGDLDSEEIESELKTIGPLDAISFDDLPKEAGLFTFVQENKSEEYLYVGSAKKISEAVRPFDSGKPFVAMSGRFWKPDPSHIILRYTVAGRHNHILGTSMRNVSLKLIEDRHPLFNMPVHLGHAEKAA